MLALLAHLWLARRAAPVFLGMIAWDLTRSVKLKPNSIVVILVSADWADSIKAEEYLGPSKDASPPNLKAFAVRILDTSHQLGLVVRAIYGNQPKDNEIRLVVPWQSLQTIVWRPNMEITASQVGYLK